MTASTQQATRSTETRKHSLLPPRSLILVAICVVATVAETAAVIHTGARGAVGMAPQAAAPAPFGVFHDLRWLLVFASSWPRFALELTALIVVRSALTMAQMWAAWPVTEPRPPAGKLATRSLLYTVVAAILLAPWASLLVALALAPVSYLWFAAVPSALCVALLVHHGTVLSWWRHHPRLRSTGWIAVSYIVLTLFGAAMVIVPRPAIVPLAVAAGVFNAVAWRGVIGALASAPTRPRFAPVAPVGLVALGVAACLGVAFSVHPAPSPAQETLSTTASFDHGRAAFGHGQPVLMASGYGIAWDGSATSLGHDFAVERFSYRGSGANGDPLPYTARSTLRSLPDLVALMRTQVDRMAARWHRPVDIVAESEGALVTTAYLMSTPDAPVARVALLSPLVSPARATFPPPGNAGWGLAAGWQLRGISSFVRDVSTLEISPDSPFIESLAAHGTALGDAFGCPVDGVEQLAVMPLADAVGMPYELTSQLPHRIVLAFHGTLLTNTKATRIVRDWLLTGTAPGDRATSLARRAAAAAGLAWQVPDLSLATGSAPASQRCEIARDDLRAWLGTSGA